MAERFNPPPGWQVPPGFEPPEGWRPDPSWPPAPDDWTWWVPDDAIPTAAQQPPPWEAHPRTPYAQPPSPYVQTGAGSSARPPVDPGVQRRRAGQAIFSGVFALVIAFVFLGNTMFQRGGFGGFMWIFVLVGGISIVRGIVGFVRAGRS